MSDEKTLMIVDGENLLHRAYHKFLNLKSTDGRPSGAIFGFLKILSSLIVRYPVDSLIITFDNGKSIHRLRIHPEYKANRGKIDMDYESLQKQKRAIMRFLRCLNIPYIFDRSGEIEYEGDDYITLIKHLYKGKVIIVSSDKDFCQLICSRVKVFNPSKDMLISKNNCRDIMGYSPLECVDYLCLVGDKSDNIPGYPGIGEVKARKFLDEYGSILNYLLKEPDEDKYLKMKSLYNRNRILIDLKFFLKKHSIINNDNRTLELKYPFTYSKDDRINKKRLLTLSEKYSIKSLKTEEFLSGFKKLKRWEING